jgi:long-chain acyl-CoA synthetase
MTITAQLIQDKIREITSAGQFFEMEDREVAGRRVRLYKHAPATLVDVLQASRAHGAADFIVYEGRRLSFDRFFAEADALAATLQREHGIGKGDRVAIAMRNCPEWSVAFTAATRWSAPSWCR